MILTGNEILKEFEKGNIVISPFNENLINPNSYNYRLGKTLIEFNNSEDKLEYDTKEIIIPEDGYILKPGKLYLGVTYERIGSSKYATSLIGRSSIGRLGLHLQISANLGHTGTYHSWTLELRACLPIKVYPNMKIGQVSFWNNLGSVELYEGKYKDYSVPHKAIKEKIYI